MSEAPIYDLLGVSEAELDAFLGSYREVIMQQVREEHPDAQVTEEDFERVLLRFLEAVREEELDEPCCSIGAED